MATLDFIILFLVVLILGYFASSVLSFLTGYTISAIIGTLIPFFIFFIIFIFIAALSMANFDD